MIARGEEKKSQVKTENKNENLHDNNKFET